jgi:polyvinyl alcohol dehydrogenase (cytochrome)
MMSLSQGGRARRAGSLVVAVIGLGLVSAPGAGAVDAPWPMGGQNISNTRSAADAQVGVPDARRLRVKWTYTTHGDVSATAAVVGGAVYFPDWGGYLNKVDAKTGVGIWSRKLSTYAGEPLLASQVLTDSGTS